MSRKKARNVYCHVLRKEQEARDIRFAKAAVYGGVPLAMAAVLGALTCMQPRQEVEHGYAPLETAERVLECCKPRTDDLNGNGKLETVCDDAYGRYFRVLYEPEGGIRLKQYARDVDLTKPYNGQKQNALEARGR